MFLRQLNQLSEVICSRLCCKNLRKKDLHATACLNNGVAILYMSQCTLPPSSSTADDFGWDRGQDLLSSFSGRVVAGQGHDRSCDHGLWSWLRRTGNAPASSSSWPPCWLAMRRQPTPRPPWTAKADFGKRRRSGLCADPTLSANSRATHSLSYRCHAGYYFYLCSHMFPELGVVVCVNRRGWRRRQLVDTRVLDRGDGRKQKTH